MSDSYSVSLGATDDDFQRAMEAAAASAESSATQIGAAFDAAAADISAAVEEAKASLEDLSHDHIEPSVGLDDAAAKVKLDELKASVDEIGAKSPSIGVTADTASAQAKLAALKASEDALSGTHININTSGAAAGLGSVSAAARNADLSLDNVVERALASGAAFEDASGRLHLASGQFTSASSLLQKLTSDSDGAGAAMEKLGEGGNSSGGGLDRAAASAANADNGISGLMTAILALGPAAVTAAAVIASAFAALPALFAGLSAGVGSVFLAFGGVKTALTDASAAQTAAAHSAGSNANAQNQQAQAAIQAAMSQMQQAQSAQQASQQVQSATQALANAQVQAAASVHSAQGQLIQSEQQLAQSEYQEQQAQLALTQARQQAADQLINLNDQVKDGALAIQQAQLDIASAKATMDADLTNPAVSQLQRQQDQLTYNQAVQHLTDLQDQQAQLQTQQQAATQAGVDGAPAVVQAQNAVQQATQGVANAQQSQADAATSLAQTQVSAQQQVANAVQNLANSQAALVYQQKQSALQQQQQALQQAASAAAAGGASSATTAYQQALAKLTPAGREFVSFVQTTLQPIYKQLQATAQTTLLPGLQTGITGLLPLVSVFSDAISVAGQGIGSFVQGLAKILTSTSGLAEVTTIVHEGSGLMQALGNATLNVVQAFLNIGSQAGPIVSALGGGIERLASDFNNWSTDGGFQKFLSYVEQHGPQVKQLFHEIGQVLGDILHSAAIDGPAITVLSSGFLSLANALLRIPGLGPLVLDIAAIGAVGAKTAGTVGKIASGFSDLGKFLSTGGGLMSAIRSLGGALGIIGPAGDVAAEGEAAATGGAVALDTALLPIIATIGLIVLAVAAIGIGAYELVTHWHAVQTFFVGLWDDVKRIFDDALGFIKTNLGTIAPIIATLLLGPIGGIVVLIATHWNTVKSDTERIFGDIVNFFTGLPGRIVNALGDIVSKIWGVMTGSVSWIDTNAIQPVVGFFTGIPGRVVSALGDIVSTIWTALTSSGTWIDSNVLQPVVGFFTGLPSRLMTGLGSIVSTVFGGMTGAWDWIKSNVYDPIVNGFAGLPGDIAKVVEGALGKLGDLGKDLINWVIDGLNDMINFYDSHRPSLFGLSPLPYIPPIPTIAMADGGVVRARPGGTLALLGEGGRDEAVVPLDHGWNRNGAAAPTQGHTFNNTFITQADETEIGRVMGWQLRLVS